ncbi:MAG: hypothetical protein QOE32_500 [Pseudonocardiales bacterium]|nr:hypothetical protein [Pseudonocardiales bacterium]
MSSAPITSAPITSAPITSAPIVAVPPSIVLLDAGGDARLLREVCAGAEEEGVPVDVETADGPESVGELTSGAATGLAYLAAGRSRLQVGIGLDRAGGVAVHHSTLPEHAPALTVASGAGRTGWRRAGRVAARIVKRLPLA